MFKKTRGLPPATDLEDEVLAGFDKVFLVKRGRPGHVGYREADGRLWFPDLGKSTDVLSFSRDEAFALISVLRRPLLGHEDLPTLEWLPQPEECLGRARYSGKRPLDAIDVYLALWNALASFRRAQRRLGRVWTKENLKHAKLLKKKCKELISTLKDPRTLQIYGDSSLASSLANSERDHKRFAWIADIIEREIATQSLDTLWVDGDPKTFESLRTVPCECRNLEAFVRGPLAQCYERLTGDAPGHSDKPDRPFPRFGECFLGIVGHPTKRTTIASAIKKGDRARAPALSDSTRSS